MLKVIDTEEKNSHRFQWKENSLFLLNQNTMKQNIFSSLNIMSMAGVKEMIGIDHNTLGRDTQGMPFLGIKRNPIKIQIGPHHLWVMGFWGGIESILPQTEMGGHHLQQRGSIMIKTWTEETGDHQEIGMTADQDHLHQEVKGTLDLLGMIEIGHLLSHQAIVIQDLGQISQVEDLLFQGMTGIEKSPSQEIDLPFQWIFKNILKNSTAEGLHQKDATGKSNHL